MPCNSAVLVCLFAEIRDTCSFGFEAEHTIICFMLRVSRPGQSLPVLPDTDR